MTLSHQPSFWSPSLKAIFQYLDNGECDAAAQLLFDPNHQQENRRQFEYWYAQILVAAIQEKGFHITFLTAVTTFFNRKVFLGEISMNDMASFFKKYAAKPEYSAHREKILRLIDFYEEWYEENTRRLSQQRPRAYRPMRRLTSPFLG